MFFRKKKEKGAQLASSLGDTGKDLDQAKDAIASMLRTLSEYALPTTGYSLDQFTRRCDAIARELLLQAGSGEEDFEPRPLRKLFTELRQIVRTQRAAESKEYSAHKEGAQVIVANFAMSLRTALVERETQNSEVFTQLTEMEAAVATGDLGKIRSVSSLTAKYIRKIITTQQADDQAQLEKLSEQLREMRVELNEAKTQADRDGLTDLHNRASFDKTFDKTVAFAHASGMDLTLYMLDLDHFKQVNDQHGHQAGDEVLKKVSGQLLRCFPRKDDLVARYGGEEFTALCRNVGDEHASMLGERVRAAVEKLSIPLAKGDVTQTISVGFAVLRPGEDSVALLKRADEALYGAKGSGRNRVVGAS